MQTTVTAPKSVREFNALQSVDEKLAFDPSGRPGADIVRELQASIRDDIAKSEYIDWMASTTVADRLASSSNNEYISQHVSLLKAKRRTLKTKLRPTLPGKRGAWPDCKNLHRGRGHDARYAAWRQQYTSNIPETVTNQQLILAHRASAALGRKLKTYSYVGQIGDVEIGSWGKINDYYFCVVEESSTEWVRYSRRHNYPRTTVHARYVLFSNGKQTIRVDLDGWRGNWFLNAVKQAGIVAPIKQNKAITLHPACSAIKLRNIGDVTMHKIMCGNMFWQYCASVGSANYHAKSYKDAISGLKYKLRATASGEYVTRALAKKLGFCDAGINAFIDAYGLTGNEIMTPNEFEKLIRNHDLATAEPFVAELKTLANHFNMNIPEFQ